MKTSDFDYDLPETSIAQTPAQPRDMARLLVADRNTRELIHTEIKNLDQFLSPGDLLVINQTRVLPARLPARKIPSGGKAEILLISRYDELTWEILIGGRGIHEGQRLALRSGLEGVVIQDLPGPRRMIKFNKSVDGKLDELGKVPLPPYIKQPIVDPERYQTIFADKPGSTAAPTAGLHFSPGLFTRLAGKGIRNASITLHIGLDTFGPVTEENPEDHQIHTEWCQIPPTTVKLVNQTHKTGGRVVAVGTTSVRALETASQGAGRSNAIHPFEGPTDLFILPGYHFQIVDILLTNFHLPRSSLLMLASSFAGSEFILKAYQAAIKHGYRFYSFGDAMLIL